MKLEEETKFSILEFKKINMNLKNFELTKHFYFSEITFPPMSLENK